MSITKVQIVCPRRIKPLPPVQPGTFTEKDEEAEKFEEEIKSYFNDAIIELPYTPIKGMFVYLPDFCVNKLSTGAFDYLQSSGEVGKEILFMSMGGEHLKLYLV